MKELLTDLQLSLLEGLKEIPEDWALTPLLGNKAPYRTGWQHETPLSRNQIIAEVKSGNAKGYGIRTGEISGGLLAIDFDGFSAFSLALTLGKNEPLPLTPTFTSNRPGREQRLYRIPQEFWGRIRTTKLKTGKGGDDGKPEQLELRWNNCQSCLPPSTHPLTGNYRWRVSPHQPIAIAPMWVIEQMLIPKPLDLNMTDEEWALNYLNALSPSRADDYQDWLTVGMALHSVNDSLLTHWDNWSSQSSKYNPGDCEKKWRSFKSNGVGIGSLAHLAKTDGWRLPSRQPSQVVPTTQTVQPNTTEADLITQIDSLIKKDLPKSTVQIALTKIAKQAGWVLKDIFSLYNARLSEKDNQRRLDDEFSNLEKLIEHQTNSQQINWQACLPETLYKALWSKSESDRIDIIFLIHYLFPAFGGMIGAKLGIVVKEGATPKDDWVEYPNLWTAIIAAPSSGKSVAERAIFNPIREIQDDEIKRYTDAQKELEQVEEAWKQKSKEEKATLWDSTENPVNFKEQQVGKCRKFLLEYGRIEAIIRRLSEQPNRAGSIWESDEILSIFDGADEGKNGKGIARKFLLNAWNGPLSGYVDRVNEAESFVLRGQLLNLCGGIQLEPARKFFNPQGDNSDEDGLLSRMLLAVPEFHPQFALDADITVDLSPHLENLYEKARDLPSGLIQLSPSAKKERTYQDQKLRRGYLTYLESNPAFAYFLGKMRSNLMRIALVIHCLEHCYFPKHNFFQLELDTLKRAIEISNFYTSQFRIAQAKFTQTPDEGLPEFLFQILNFCLKQGSITPSQVVDRWRRKTGKKGKPIKSPDVREMFETLAKVKPQQVVYDGKRLTSVNATPQKYDRFPENTIAIRSPDRPLEVPPDEGSDKKYDQYDRICTEKTANSGDFPVQESDRVIVFSAEPPAVEGKNDTIARSYCDRICPENPIAPGGETKHNVTNQPRPNVGDRISYKHWCGRLVSKSKAGWFIQWDKTPHSIFRDYGSPPNRCLGDEEFEVL